ncbi:protein-cysteine N-palmitoyltransferase HHAT-like protein isoform X3 [Neofelis nebulosa]|uniref:protein-cysteine N-palmitoyltransferase HHAT-like protein isoform X3 n=1 Tax=Neofelis nebulosa TaxID=61452 RepID=UPI00272B33FD|nr:protein-cysteine N-palmitoyltransferase HHAT-like protein isoform X3 [Neofelis nebulosa]
MPLATPSPALAPPTILPAAPCGQQLCSARLCSTLLSSAPGRPPPPCPPPPSSCCHHSPLVALRGWGPQGWTHPTVAPEPSWSDGRKVGRRTPEPEVGSVPGSLTTSSSTIQAMGIKTALPAVELGLYSLVLSGALAYAGRGLLEASQDGAHRKAFRESVRPGWEYIGRKMDVADFEWVMWFTSFRNVIIFALSGHVLFAKLCTMVAPQSGFVTGTFDLQEVLFHGGSGFTVLRCTSFALESCAHPDRRYSLADLLKYNFYLPFFFFGPIMTFDRFHTQMSQVEPVRREGELWRIRAQAGLSVVAVMAVDIFFHFFYILTIPNDLKFANRLPDSALAGLAYSNLVYDWVKAAVLFGVVNTVARLDHLDPPQPPKCITALYVFAETHFDRGINDWLCKYVYDHIGGEHSEVIPELGATVATFAITTLWLGPCDIVYLWSFLNCFGLNFELWVQKLAESGPLAQIEVSGEGLGSGWLGHWRGWHCCSLESSSHMWPPVQNFLSTPSLLSGQWLPLWVSSTSFYEKWAPAPGCVGPDCPLSLVIRVLIFNTEGELGAWVAQLSIQLQLRS